MKQLLLICMLLQAKEENDVTNMSIEQFLENIELFLSVIGAFLSLVVAIIICAIKFMKTIKSTQSLKDVSDILDAVGPIMEIAESFVNYTGAEKKNFVLTQVEQLASENGITINASIVSDKIEELIQLSKKINYIEKKEEKTNG